MRLSDKYEVRKYKACNEDIESFLRENGTVFHSHEFLNAVGDDYTCITIEEKDTIAAALPLVRTTKWGLRGYHIPPNTHIFGPVISKSYHEKSYLLTKTLLQSLPKAMHYDFKIYNNGDVLPYLELGFTVNITQSHIRKSNAGYTLNSISKNKKRDINKLNKLLEADEIVLIENDKTQNGYILDLYRETSKRAGFKPQIDKLERLLKSDIPYYTNIIKDVDGNAIAGTFCPRDQHSFYHILSLGLRLEDQMLSRANYLSLFYAVQFANQNNLNFDFEGSSIPGVAHFYRMMGAAPMTMIRAQKSRSFYYHMLRFGNTVKSEFKTYKE